MTTFTVDTHLFRELGELLVGRDSTALIELIKNSYDADATRVVVYGESLAKPNRGFIRIQDNGIGMNRSEFENGFLRIASRTKETPQRRSKLLQRRYTGAKGIGRLAAHKLARSLEISSHRWNGRSSRHGSSLPSSGHGVNAKIDWDEIEAHETLEQIDHTDAIRIRDVLSGTDVSAGTTITLRNLRRSWSLREHAKFMEELQAFQAPPALINPLPASVARKLLFATPKLRDVSNSNGSEFHVDLEGELSPPHDYWMAVIQAANWVIEIDAGRGSGTVRFVIAPTEATLNDLPHATSRAFEMPHPNPRVGPFFQARILKRTGVLKGDEPTKQWAGRSSGVRVFMEGFRVLPYGDLRDDWLELDRDYAERGRWTLDASDNPIARQLTADESVAEAGLNHLPNKHYFGGVFLTERNAPTLSMLVNREGFIPNESYNVLADLVRKGIDLSTRVQMAATAERRMTRATDRRTVRNSPENVSSSSSNVMPTAHAIQNVLAEAKQSAGRARQHVAAGRVDEAAKEFNSALARVQTITDSSDDLVEEAAMIRVLASAGTQIASFVHEINGLRDMATAIDRTLADIRSSTGLSKQHRQELSKLQKDVGDLRRSIERHASYLVDVVSPDARRRRSRQIISKRFESGAKLVTFVAENRQIKIINKIPDDLRSPPMFAAELTTVFSNLLSNAVKAVGKKGVIRAWGKSSGQKTTIRVENTGARVRLKDSERWFNPFESTTTEVDAVLGQGMGLGLPITRSMLEEYGATIKFVEPTSGFSTAIQIEFAD